MKKNKTLSFLCVLLLALIASNAYAQAELEGLEVVFVMDSSTSMDFSGWDSERNFVVEMIDNILPEDAGIGIVRFASSVVKEWSFNDNQDRATIIDEVESLEWMQGVTPTRSALDDAIEVFEDTSDGLSRRTVVLITDGNPNPQMEQNPCTMNGDYAALAAQTRSDLEDLSIQIFLVGVGDELNPYVLSCLWEGGDEDKQLIEVETFDDLAAAASVLGQNILDWDGDGVDSPENCPNISNPSQADNDLDGFGDACDEDDDDDGTIDVDDSCPMDSEKIVVGICGCGTADTDSDGDGTVTCVDDCPDDPEKNNAGTCGCGTADTDSDGDGTADCVDNCPDDSEKTEAGINGCGNSDTDDDEDIDEGICGDGVVDAAVGEECDDSNADDYDGCSSTCAIETHAELETDNDEVDFDNIEVGDVIYVQSPMPTGSSSSLNSLKALATDSECSCSWTLNPDTAGTISDDSACSTSLTLSTTGNSNLSVYTDCGAGLSATFNQTLVVDEETSTTPSSGGSSSSGGCQLQPNHKQGTWLSLFMLTFISMAVFLVRRKKPVHN